MGQDALIAFPLHFLLALLWAVIAVLALRLDLATRRTPLLFCGLFVVFALESFLVGLRFGYGVTGLVVVQRALPLLVGPLMYLGFASLAVPSEPFRRMLMGHLGAVGVLLIGFQIAPSQFENFDWVIAASYGFYAVALLLLWRKGSDHLIFAHLSVTRAVRLWMLGGVGFLLMLLVMDTAIAVSFALNQSGRALSIISLGSLLLIPLLVALFLVVPKFSIPRTVAAREAVSGDLDANALEAEVRALLVASKFYLEPDLSVQRLAKRLHVPVRNLSVAINESQGMNVSQYVNGFRLAHAAELLRQSDESVMTIFAQSGFLTRSNFYREFQRVYGCSPAVYRKGMAPDQA